MHVALLGGTGDIGEGLALRWGHDTDHHLTVGSRDADRAADAAADYEAELAERGVDATVDGAGNADAAAGADVVVLAVPAYHAADTVDAVADALDGVLVTPAVGMSGGEDGLRYNPPSAGSVTELVAERAPDGVPVVGAFHNLPAGRLADLDADLGIDTLVVGDDPDATATVAYLAGDIEGLRALSAGGLAAAREVEAVTPLLVNVARENEGLHDLGLQFR